MRRLLCVALGMTLATAGISTANAEESPVVVELYTSQGCSSCPAADAILSSLADREDVIALALHVDYWDYIGWPDTFAKPGFTKRQKAYARAAGAHTIYTPQMIVQGREQLIGARPGELVESIAREMQGVPPVAIEAEREGDSLRIRAVAQSPMPEGAVVQLVRYRPSETVLIERGENAGRSIDYRNIVTDWTLLGDWDGTGPLDLSVPVTGTEPSVVILQEPGPGAILAARRIP